MKQRRETSDRVALDSQRGHAQDPHRFASQSPVSPTTDRRLSQTSPVTSIDFQRAHNQFAQQYLEHAAQQNGELDTYFYPNPHPDESLRPHSVEFWNRPDGTVSPTDATNMANANVSVNGNINRVAARPVSAFNHHHRAIPNGAVGDSYAHSTLYVQNNGLYSSYSPEFTRDSGEPLLLPPSTATIPVSGVTLLQQQELLDVNPARAATGTQTSHRLSSSRSTLWWGELEPWMDEEYAKQVCGLMGWDPVSVKIPHAPADPVTGQQANNPGYCFLTFPSPSHAAAVLSQVHNPSNSGQPIMPNSTKPFVLNWASSPSPALAGQAYLTPTNNAQNATGNQGQKEYSIFVGDLAPETSNSDLVAVFRNPVLGLRNDRAPKFIRPFYSCKSAKIMLDPVTGVSRGYGFVRFTDEADQQRALIEMHGLYCLSRPSEFACLATFILV